MSHDDRAADVTLPEILAALYDVGACMDEDCDQPVCVVRKVREAIAAGSAVVRVGEPPEWMERAVAAERERCERIAKERSSRREVSPWSMGWRDCAEAIAAAIRGGGDTPPMIWRCDGCGATFAEYVNGCPHADVDLEAGMLGVGDHHPRARKVRHVYDCRPTEGNDRG